ncbi:MAG: MaoC family dehydratase [Gammaproteobacteria bacterium]|nr:MaoC family dehydratase [Gammaproteobacteria bacterium]
MRIATFNTPPNERYFEDYEVGATYECGEFSLSETEIIAFAQRFDPQAFHLDREAAAKSHFGGIIASGWHIGSAMMRVIVDNFLSPVASMGSPGVDEIRWLKPVRPDEVLKVRVTVEQARLSVSKPDRGLVHNLMEVVDRDAQVRMHVRSVGLIGCRPR